MYVLSIDKAQKKMGWSSIEILDKRTLSSKVINNSWRKACHFSPFHVSILAFIALFSTVPEIWNAISRRSVSNQMLFRSQKLTQYSSWLFFSLVNIYLWSFLMVHLFKHDSAHYRAYFSHFCKTFFPQFFYINTSKIVNLSKKSRSH